MMIGGSELTRLSQYLHRDYKTSLASMTSDLDIYRTASVLTREHGEDAALEAAQSADAMLEKGCLDGQRGWKRVLAAVKEIQRQEPREGDAVN